MTVALWEEDFFGTLLEAGALAADNVDWRLTVFVIFAMMPVFFFFAGGFYDWSLKMVQ